MSVPDNLKHFYLEPDSDYATSKPPVLRCYGEKLLSVPGCSEKILVCEMRENVEMKWDIDKKITTKTIAISIEHGEKAIEDLDYKPLFVMIYLVRDERMRSVEDFECIAKGMTFKVIPTVCEEMWGYGY